MSKKKKKAFPVFRRIVIIGGILILVQVGLIFFFSQKTQSKGIREAIDKTVENSQGLAPFRKEILRVQLALQSFREENKKLPNSLNELRPKYLDDIPIDPQTKKQVRYVIDGEKFTLGEPQDTIASTSDEGGESGDKPLGEIQQTALIDSLDAPTDINAYVYDPQGKRDPFRPFSLAPRYEGPDNRTPLERFGLDQLKLTAVLAGIDQPTATVETTEGKGFLIKKGTKIGTNGGEVVEILPDRVRILEESIDFTGEKHSKVIEIQLRGRMTKEGN